jgi:hypothetical protein
MLMGVIGVQVFVLRSWFQNPEQIQRDAKIIIVLLITIAVVVNIPLLVTLFTSEDTLGAGFFHKVGKVDMSSPS